MAVSTGTLLVLLHYQLQPASGWRAGDGWPGIPAPSFNRALPTSMQSWVMNESTLVFFVGNATAADSPQEIAAEGRFATVGIGWQLQQVQRNFTHLEAAELATAKQIKQRYPKAEVMVTRNTDCGGINWDAVLTAVSKHPEWFLRQPDRSGNLSIYTMPWVANDPPWQHHSEFFFHSAYFNYSSKGASDWWVTTFVGAAVSSPLLDGIYWDACGPDAPPVTPMKRGIPCPGCRFPPALKMSDADQGRYLVDAHSAFLRAEALIAAAGKWSTTWAGYAAPKNVSSHGIPVTTPQCVGDVVQLVDAAAIANQTFQLLVPIHILRGIHTPHRSTDLPIFPL